MNKKNRFMIAMTLSIVLVLIAVVGAWAAPKFQGTVPPIPVTGGSTDGSAIDMKTAIITPQCAASCTVTVDLVQVPSVPAPTGLAFVGNTFNITVSPADSLVQVCYAMTPELAAKNAKIYKLNTTATPNVWVEVPGAVTNANTICVSSGAGTISLIGNP